MPVAMEGLDPVVPPTRPVLPPPSALAVPPPIVPVNPDVPINPAVPPINPLSVSDINTVNNALLQNTNTLLQGLGNYNFQQTPSSLYPMDINSFNNSTGLSNLASMYNNPNNLKVNNSKIGSNFNTSYLDLHLVNI